MHMHLLYYYSKKITGLCVTAYGNLLMSGSADTTVRVWDIASQQTLKLISMKGIFVGIMLREIFTHIVNPFIVCTCVMQINIRAETIIQ